ncbi:hypothetical protein [Sulfitobacter aestuariivivens]|uniref:Uncharacterized protein n=1 Tax=Sulfitobacter aestuariivivens TaxID=2766981 RepID=A0A927D2Q0_9RHOB|nr:hypothetical protein [Sulfitobacter aestuariivivens]MBD3663935.1 hypothetical protein [Sulfitobacter aestuariivivens]
MKLVLTSAAAALISTAAVADESDRYNDLRLDTSTSAAVEDVRSTDLDDAQRGREGQFSTADNATTPDVTLSTRSETRTNGEGYIYGGFGPGNDSR